MGGRCWIVSFFSKLCDARASSMIDSKRKWDVKMLKIIIIFKYMYQYCIGLLLLEQLIHINTIYYNNMKLTKSNQIFFPLLFRLNNAISRNRKHKWWRLWHWEHWWVFDNISEILFLFFTPKIGIDEQNNSFMGYHQVISNKYGSELCLPEIYN